MDDRRSNIGNDEASTNHGNRRGRKPTPRRRPSRLAQFWVLAAIFSIVLNLISPLVTLAAPTGPTATPTTGASEATAPIAPSTANRTSTASAAPPSPTSTKAASPTATTTSTASPTSSPTIVPTGPMVPILVKYHASSRPSDVDTAIRAAGGQSVRDVSQIRTRVVSVPASLKDQALAALAKNPNVERADAAIKLSKASGPNDPGYAQQWALPKIAWDQAYGAVQVNGTAKIAVMDTGVDATHPDLAPVMALGQSYIGGDPNSDPNGHGTELAGIAAAVVNNATGVAGVAWTGASVSSVQVLQADGTGYDSDVVSGVTWAADNGANVILMGFNSSGYSASLADALAYAWSKGVVLVAATGNDGTTAVTYPSGMPNVIGVAATDQNDSIADNSNLGSAAVAAPGDNIYTTQPGGNYGTISGTSAAAAHVAGLAALLVASGKNNSDASNQIRGAVDSLSGQPFGRIDVATALGAPLAPVATSTVGATPTAGASPTYVAAATSTSTTVTCSPNPDAINSATTCTASVSASGSSKNPPTGTISWTTSGGGTFSSTSCALTGSGFTLSCHVDYTPNATGTQTISATYTPDTGAAPDPGSSNSTALSAVRATTTSVACGPNPDVTNGATACVATVQDTSSGTVVTPTGTVSFSSSGSGSFFTNPCTLVQGANPIGTSSCSVTYTPSSAGTLTITGSYSPASGDNHRSSSGTFSLSVTQSTTTSTSCTATSVTLGGSTVCTATVTDPTHSNDPTGTISWTVSPTGSGSFSAGSTGTFSAGPPPTCTLVQNGSSGTSSCSVTYTPSATGTPTLTASYSGDSSYAASSGMVSLTVTLRATSTSVSCSPTSLFVNSPATTCTATMTDTSAGTASAPTGSVSWSSSNGTGGTFSATTCVLSGSGASATCSVAYTPSVTGSQTITASYPGDANHIGSSGTATISLSLRGTTTSVSCSLNPDLVNAGATCTATVTDSSGGTTVTPAGTVSWSNGGASGSFSASTCTLSGTGSSASCQVSYTPTASGSATISTSYSPSDSVHLASNGATTLTVNPRKTSTTVTCNPNPDQVSQPTSCTATVTDADAGTQSTPAGTVSWSQSGGNGLFSPTSCTLTGSGVSASCSASFTPSQEKTYSINATYTSNDNVHANSTVNTYSLTVNTNTNTTTTVSSLHNPSVSGQSVTFTATISPSTATGSVQFQSDGANFGTPVTVSGGSATSQAINTLAVGSHTVTATYSPSGSFNGSSGTLSQTVNQASTTTSLTSSANPSVFGQSITFTAAVSVTSPGAGAPTGTVTFNEGTTTVGTGTLSTTGGVTSATLSTSNLAVGSHGITATYGGDTNFNRSTSTTLTQTVTANVPTATKSTVVANPTSVVADGSTTSTITVTLMDSGNNPVSGKTVTLGQGSGSSTISAASGPSNASGQVTFTVKDTKAESVTYTATDTTDNNLTIGSAQVAFIAGAATKLVFAQQPTSTVAGQAISPAVTVQVQDANGNLVTASTAPVSLAITGGTGTAGATLGGTTSANASGGIATFSNLFIDKAGTVYTLSASSSGLTGATSTAFNVTARTTGVAVSCSPSSVSVNSGAICTATVTDTNGSGSSTPTGTITFGASGNGSFSSTTCNLTAGSCSVTYTPSTTTGSPQTINASYGGDAAHATSSGATSLTVTLLTTSLTISAASGVYGGTTTLSATLKLGSSGASGKTISFSVNNGGVGTATTDANGVASLNNVSLGRASAGTYATGVTASFAGDDVDASAAGSNSLTISPATLTVTGITAANKVYDGGTTATLNSAGATLVGVVSGDTVTLAITGATGSFADKNVGSNKTVTVSGLTITGNDSGNYTLTQPTATASITAKALTVTGIPANNKTYDGGTAATLNSGSAALNGVVSPDSVTLATNGASASFADKNVGSNKPVTISGLTIGGTSAGNYTLTQPSASANITARSLTVTATGSNKAYDGTTAATVTLADNRVSGDSVTDSYLSANFADKSVGTNKTINVAGISVGGTDAGNYSLSNTMATTTANITALALTVTATGQDKVYDGNTSATVILSDNRLNGDQITDSYSSAAFADKNVGSSKSVTVSGISIGGTDAGNYTLQNTTASTTANITAQALTVTADNKAMTYGGTVPSLTFSLSGFVSGDTSAVVTGSPTLSTTASSASGIGTYPIKVVDQGSLSAANYSFPSASFVNGTLTVGKATLSVTADNQSRTYGDANPTFAYAIAGFVNGDTASVVSGTPLLSTAATATSPVGSYPIAVDVSPLSATNYQFSPVSGTLTVGAAVLTVTANDASKTYGDANPSFGYTVSGFKNGETETELRNAAPAALSGLPSLATSADASSAVAGSPYTITAAIGSLTATNYTFSFANGKLTINPAPLTVTPANASRLYGAANPGFTGTIVGIKNSDNLTATYSTSATSTSPVAVYTITAALNDPDHKLVNYSVTLNQGTLTINPAPLTIAAKDQETVYGAIGFDSSTSSLSFSGFVNGEGPSALGTGLTITSNVAPKSGVGTYALTPSGAQDANYAIAYVDGTLTVNPAALTITTDDKSMTYGGTLPALTWTANFVNGDTAASLATQPTCTTVAASSDVGSYAITCSGAVDANYSITFVNGKLTITKAPLTITANDKAMVYGALVPTLDGAIVGIENGDNITATYATAATQASVVGSYPIAPTPSDNGTGKLANYTVTLNNGTLTISAAGTTTTVQSPPAVTYGAASATLTALVGANRPSTATVNEGAVTFTVTSASNQAVGSPVSGNVGSGVATATFSLAGLPAGTYSVVPSYADGGSTPNFLGSASAPTAVGTLTINPAPLTITADNQSKTYDGAAFIGFTASYSGFVNNENQSSLGGKLTYGGSAVGAINAGSYTITPAGLTSTNYAITFKNGSLTINTRPVTATADSQTKTYGDADPTLTYRVTSGSLVTGDSFSGSLSRDAGENVGSYNITEGSLALSSNYALTFVGSTLTITPRAASVTAASTGKVYGASDPTPATTNSGFLATDLGTGKITFGASRAAGEDVGAYAITPSASDNSTGLLKNYSVTYVNATFTITPATLTVTANPQTKVYGAADPALSYQVTGLQFSDTAATVLSGGLARAAGESVAQSPYAIGQGTLASNSNYTVSFTGSTLTITPAPLTITANNQTMIYGGTMPALTVTYTGLVNGDTVDTFTKSPNSPAVASTVPATSHAGSYAITASGVADSNYTIGYKAGTLAVNPAPLTITADNQTMVYGAALPALTASYTGLVNGDTPATFAQSPNVAPAVATTATSASHVAGSLYPITVGDAVDADYSINYVAGKLTVLPAPLTIAALNQGSIYGTSTADLTLNTNTIKYTGFVNGDDASKLATTAVLHTTASLASPVGGYPITVDSATSSDYTISFVNGTLTVGPAPLTITAKDQGTVYGAIGFDASTSSLSFSGFVNGEGPSALGTGLTITSNVAPKSGVGPYVLSPVGALDANYKITYVNGTLTVNPAALSVGANSASRVYGDANPTLTGTLTGVQNGDNITATYGTAATPTSAVGTYLIVPTLVDPGNKLGNYSVTATNGTLTVTVAPLTVTPANASRLYGAANPGFTGTIVGIKNSDNLTATYATAATAASPVGTYAITATLVDPTSKLGNYSVTLNQGVLSVTPAPLTVTANNATKVYGDANPAFSVGYSGFVNGDTASSLGGSLAFSTPATAASGVGSYAVTPSGLTSTNYTITFVNGTLVVTPATLTVTANDASRLYGAANPAFAASYAGFKNGDTSSVLSGSPSLTTQASTGSPVGSYAIVAAAGTLTAANYQFAFVNGTLTITTASTATMASAAAATYGAGSIKLSATVSAVGPSTAVVNEGSVTFSVTSGGTTIGSATTANVSSGAASATYTFPTTTNAGTYTIVATYNPATSAPNFTGSSDNTKSLTINPATTTVTVTQPPAVTYGSTSVALSANVTSATNATVNQGTATFTLQSSGNTLGTPVTVNVSSTGSATATYALPSGTVGSYTIVVAYNPPTTGANFVAGNGSGTLSVQYQSGGTCDGDVGHAILQPVNPDGSSTFKVGSTVPVKFRVCDVNGVSIGSPAAVVDTAHSNSVNPGDVTGMVITLGTSGGGTMETVTSTTPDTTFRWDSTNRQWIFNLQLSSTAGATGTAFKSGQKYQGTIYLLDGSTIVFNFATK